MGRCLSCHKPISEVKEGYHKRCARRLFDASWVPGIPFSSRDMVTQAAKMIGKISISGVQPKLSVHLDKTEKVFAVVETGGHFILKPQVEQFGNLPENENLCMNIAEDLGIETPPHGLLRFQDGRFCYIVKRFDRLKDGGKLHQEDFQQLTGIEDKYAGSAEKVGKVLISFSNAPLLDAVIFFERLLLFFIVGNGDAHLKNFSLLKKPELGYRLSPVYDVINSRLVLPSEVEEMSLSINGKRNRLKKEDFIAIARYMGIADRAMAAVFDRIENKKDSIKAQVEGSFLPIEMKVTFREIFEERWTRLFIR